MGPLKGQGVNRPGGVRADRPEDRRFRDEVAAKGERMQRARRRGNKGVWIGLATFGMVGWSIAVPAVLGVALGLWLDARLGGGSRFTLSLLVTGLAFGMVNVWRWMHGYDPEGTGDDPRGSAADEASLSRDGASLHRTVLPGDAPGEESTEPEDPRSRRREEGEP